MPLILLTGYPSSGLTHRATQIITHFSAHPPSSSTNFAIQHISDDTLSIPRSAYDTARTEKDARAALSSAVKRHLGRETLVISDAMNYIKGFRYQMWCEAKSQGTGCCVVHVAANPEQATALHDQRRQDGSTLDNDNDNGNDAEDEVSQPPAYTSSTFENLISRYEEPSASARWDSPLFTVPYSDPDPPYEAIATALFSSPAAGKKVGTRRAIIVTRPNPNPNPDPEPTISNPNPGNQSQGDKTENSANTKGSSGTLIKPHLATVAPTQMSSDALYILERATSEIVKAILAYISTAGIGECSGEVVNFGPSSLTDSALDLEEEHSASFSTAISSPTARESLTLTLPATGTLSIAHLQRLKRQFVSLYRSRGVGMGAATSGGKGALGGAGGFGNEVVKRAFVGFLQANFDGFGD